MPRPPRIPAKDIKAALEKRVANHDRTVFHSLVTDAVRYGPRAKDFKNLRKDPERHARTLSSYAKLAGYVDKTIHETRHYDIAQLAQTLLTRHGPEKLLSIWQSMGLPISQLPAECRETQPASGTGTLLEHEALSTDRANVAT